MKAFYYLPPGKTCNDCLNKDHCAALFPNRKLNTDVCEFNPHKFKILPLGKTCNDCLNKDQCAVLSPDFKLDTDVCNFYR